MKKILHILATPRAEGTPNLVLDWLSTGLHEQEVFVLHPQPDDLSVPLRATAQWYGESNAGLLTGWRQFPKITACIRDVCLQRKPDLVICWVLGLAGWVCLGAKMAGVGQMIAHAGNPPNLGLHNDWLTRYVNWPLWGLGVKVICCSWYVRNQLRSVPFVPSSIFYAVHNCSRIEQVRQRAALARGSYDSSQVCAVMVATLESHKDHETLFKALPEVLSVYPAFHLNLVGDGSLRRKLEAQVIAFGLEHSVTFLGSRSDVPELLGQADLFVFSTTEQEGLGSVLLEALAAGLPIVASDVPACRELLEGGRWGALVPAREPGALAAAIIQTLDGLSADAEGRPENVDVYLADFTPQVMIQKYLSLAEVA